MYEPWAVVGMWLGALGLWGLGVMFTMSIMIVGSKADDSLYGEAQYND